MLMLAEISLLAGTTKVTVREIPYLLSKAIHPDIPETAEKIVSYLHKQNAENIATPTSRTEELNDDEWAVLNAIWHHLPPFRQGMTESEWEHYAETFQHAKHRPEWGLMVYWRNLATETKMLQIDAEEQHKNLLNNAILKGEVMPLNHALVPSPNLIGEALMNAFITVEDFKKYVARVTASSVKVDVVKATTHESVHILKEVKSIGDANEFEPNQAQSRDTFYPLESAALAMAHQQWNDTENNRILAVELWRYKYPNQLAPLLNGEVCDRGYLAFFQHETEIEIQDAINNLLFDGLLTLYSSNTMMPTNTKFGAVVSQNELVKLLKEKSHLKKNFSYFEKLFNGRSHEHWSREEWNQVVIELPISSETLLTIGEASSFIGNKYSLHDAAIKTLRQQLMDAVGNGLTVRHPHTDMPYVPTNKIRFFYELVRADELDKWFESQNAEYRIQPVSTKSINELDSANEVTPDKTLPITNNPLMRQRFQETEILRVIGELGFTATKFPQWEAGRRGVKAQVRDELEFPTKVFDKAWERLRADGKIKE